MSETTAEQQLRLAQEKRCREIADTIKTMLPPATGFVLMLASFDDKQVASLDDDEHVAVTPRQRFSSTSYVSTLRRLDTTRLMQEFLDRFVTSTGRRGEPTWLTATKLREYVAQFLSENTINDIKRLIPHAVTELRTGSIREQAVAALTLASYALAIFELKAVAAARGEAR